MQNIALRKRLHCLIKKGFEKNSKKQIIFNLSRKRLQPIFQELINYIFKYFTEFMLLINLFIMI